MSFNKIVGFGVVTIVLLGGSFASAQSYAGGCVNLTGDISYGQRGSQVLQLQRFLVAQNYPGGGAWMESGYFGAATLAAVRDFQQQQGLPMSGIVDAQTRAAIEQVSCGGASGYLPGLGAPGYLPTGQAVPPITSYPYPTYPNSSTYPYTTYPYTQPTYPYLPTGQIGNNNGTCGTYPYLYPCSPTNYNSVPTLTSLSLTSGVPNTSVTIYGTGFNYSSNTVYVGGTTIPNAPSYNGTSLTFTIPPSASGVVSISVGNAAGTSNALTFTVSGAPIVCGTYPYTNCTPPYSTQYPSAPYSCGYPSSFAEGYGETPYAYGSVNNCPLSVNYLSPSSGAVGSSVTVFGSGFSSTGNAVHFGNGIIANLSSQDGISLSFTVPSSLTGFGYQPVGLGTYNVSVSNSSGATSNELPFTITALGGTGTAPTITSPSGPAVLAVGQSGTWTLTVNTNGSNYSTVSVNWGDNQNGYVNAMAPQTVYGTQTVSFTHAYYVSGTYTITFTVANQSGQENTATETVNVSGSSSSGVPTITYLSPSSGYPGQQVTVYGSNFSSSNNVLNFGPGALSNLTSSGSSLTFTVPSSVGPYCAPNTACPQYLVQITPGTYNVSVMDQWGTSNLVPFTVL